MAPKDHKRPALSGTDLVHADDIIHRHGGDVAPAISVSTTFKAPSPEENAKKLTEWDVFDMMNPSRHLYSRYTQTVSTRAEKVLSHINGGYALTYASGLAACYAALVYYQPKRIAITEGYWGCHNTVEVYKKARGNVEVIGIDDDFQAGDLCWLETPLNPTGEARDIQYYAEKVHAVGGRLVVDSTFAPPPLQYPFKWGADTVMHSGTKYFGGHSDLLCGVLVVKTPEIWQQLMNDRTYMGSMMGSLESWLLLRSLRTLHLRVPKQSATATGLAQWLRKVAAVPKGQSFDDVPGGIIEKVWHSSLQGTDKRGFEPSKQLEGGWNATFALLMVDPEHATHLPHLVTYFIPATSLGGVESLMDHRITADPGADPRLIRISVGVEELEDLKDDLRKAFQELAKRQAKL
ncbi:cystathionine gamma-synthase [Heliocybe sulcata]|uniref:Cystathionine gamma-synthase n=1 Tax=Heliocybe sulcata TaxID=5364 RepID=A0A5C3NEL7_9AGAM|nr:cystathionine gamma-synthase [Heliocybe sulcata]